MEVLDLLRVPPFRSCTLNTRTWNEFLSGARACWADPSLSSPLTSPHALALSLCAYWLVLASLRVCLRGQRASFSSSRAFILVGVTHNGLLSLLSLVNCVGVTRALAQTAAAAGVRATLCTPAGARMPPALERWMYVFFLSKYWHLLDTVLLVLRGRPVTLLHLWHHSSAGMESRMWLDTGMTLGAYGMWFNSLVHFVMYAYYACALLKVRFPFKRLITLTQILQFCTSFCFLVPFWKYNSEGEGCNGVQGILASVFFNASFLVLFIRFYISTYSGSSGRRVVKDKNK